MDQHGQTEPPMAKLTSKNHRTLPILDYYLTFIHYFGFSIDPDDDHRSRYLSIRVKRAQTQPAGGEKATANREGPFRRGERQWLASYTRRAQRQFNSLPFPVFAYLKTSVKYMAITFNTFIAANHCIVLVDYICSGSRAIEEIILDIRLVITKLSALIFVLSWHHKRHEVRQLIKLVKSTSLYILATHGQQLRWPGRPAVGSGQPLLAPESPIPSPTVAANSTTCHLRAAHGQPTTGAALCVQTGPAQQPQPPGQETAGEAIISEEIGSSLRLDTSDFDRRILKGWFGCLLIIIVHFSLSEAEISKSHHLWQWLDDYSLHQLGNQSISYETLMFLASLDNYIYTVHVYGTRLIGASIICIVCSLQHEVIKSLNLYTLRLIQRSQQPLLLGDSVVPSSGAWPPSGAESSTISSKLSSPASSIGSQVSLLTSGDLAEMESSSTFFVLGESDWFQARDCRRQFEPHGHLTAFVWQTWQLQRNWLRRLAGLGTTFGMVGIRRLWTLMHSGGIQQEQPSFMTTTTTTTTSTTTQRHELADLPRATPKNGIDGARTTLGQVASTLIANADGLAGPWLGHRRPHGPLTRPTPLKLSAAMMMQADGVGIDRPTGFMHASAGRHLSSRTGVAMKGRVNRGCWPAGEDLLPADSGLCWLEPLRSGHDYHARLMAMAGDSSSARSQRPRQEPINQWTALGARKIELQMERLSTKYELVRTVNARIDACFGPMLLIQFSFLFLMSCIDLVFFSLCFSPNTKTKYIIISGMILLWCPYMLIYKFASDMGSSSSELLVSIRRLARLYLLEDQASMAASSSSSGAGLLDQQAAGPTNRFRYSHRQALLSAAANRASYGGTKIGAGIVDKLDHIFKPTHLSIMGVMTVDKFFLLNFAKIVITSSVMMIQFISN